MGWTTDLLVGVAQALDAAGVGKWRSTGSYSSGDTYPITVGALPQENVPAIGLTAYSPQDDARLSDVVQPVQFYIRGSRNVTSVDDVGDALFDLFHGVTGLTINGIPVVEIRRVSAMPMGVDGNGNWTRADNYYFHCNRPTASRPD